jgi:7,8-dihydropterin-6-yl-methyl-4-(beta-D-ribofuranosyl)aminobenzene 5'-phosphate synthase
MSFRVSPVWWPLLAAFSPVLAPLLIVRNKRFQQRCLEAEQRNRRRLDAATPLDLPELESLELTVLVEEKTEAGFLGDAGVSYLFRTDLGSLLFDVGFGPDHPTLAHNAARLGVTLSDVDALAVSHLHLDHMGGLAAARAGEVRVPEQLGSPDGLKCFVPARASGEGFECERVAGPCLLSGGIATTGPLARSLFFLGLTEELSLVARLKGKGLVVFTGCGHPGIAVILEMVRRLSSEPLYAIGGGLHFPIRNGRGSRAGIQVQRVLGTGKPPWQQIDDRDLDAAIAVVNGMGPAKVYLSAHDSCDHALERMQRELAAETTILKAGATYRI